jgi:hypothetical protein
MTTAKGGDLSLNKGQVLSGLRCHKKLWIEFHDEEQRERAPDAKTQMRFDEGRVVGTEARRQLAPGAHMAPGRNLTHEGVVERTRDAISAGERRLFEAGFDAGGAKIRADVLDRGDAGWKLIEVKSAKWPEKDRDREKKFAEHVPDVAVQVHAARAAGERIESAHLMYLNPECRHPDLSNLFTTVEVTGRAEPFVAAMPDAIRELSRVLRVDTAPDIPVGDQCVTPTECPFYERCHDELPDHHVSELYFLNAKKADDLVAQGKSMIHQLDEADGPKPASVRQIRAVKAGRRIVEPGLGAALAALNGPIIHLDFETVQLAVPRWPGCGPQDMIAVQYSVHRGGRDGGDEHLEFLAARGDDPRPALIEGLIEACRGAETILVYYEQFEKSRIRELADWFPARRGELESINERIVDLLPIVRDHVYDPAFRGSFSLKDVLPALVPGLDYSDLRIREGETAAAEIYRLLFDEKLDREDAGVLRADLLAYCRRDTEAMVRLLGVLRSIAT